MGGKKIDTSRRSFLRRSAMLMSALGVGASVQSGLLDVIGRRAKKTFGSAMAQQGFKVMRMIEVTGRAGADLKSLFAGGPEYKQVADGNRVGNLNFRWSTGSVGDYAASPGHQLYVVNVDGNGNMGPNPLQNFATDILYTHSIDGSQQSHQSNWHIRGAKNDTVWMKANTMRNPGVAAVDNVVWNPGVNVDNPGMGSVTEVDSNEDFIGLYKDQQIYFTREELKHIVGTFELNTANLTGDGALQKLDALWKNARPIGGQDDVFQVGHAGRAGSLFTVNLDPMAAQGELYSPLSKTTGAPIDVTQMMLDFGYQNNNFRAGGINLPEASFNLLRAFAHPANLALSANLQFNSGDWHGDTNGMDSLNNKQALWATIWTRMLSAYATYASDIPDLLNDPDGSLGDSIWDNTIFAWSSEFGRSLLNASDNGDRYPQSIALAGGSIPGGTRGDTVVRDVTGNDFTGYGAGRRSGLDSAGNPTNPGDPAPSDTDFYASVLKLQGWSESEIASNFPMATNVIPWLAP